MKRLRQSGFSLVELMIAILLAAITAIVVLNVLTSYQSRSNTMTGRNDAEIGAAVSLYALEKDIRMAGAGLTTPQGPFCQQGVNIAWDGATTVDGTSDGEPLLPVRIIDGVGGAPDQIEIIRSDSAFGAAPTRLLAGMAGATSALSVDGKAGLENGDLVMVGASDGSKICTLMSLTAAPAVNGSGWLLTHAPGGSSYNPADPTTTFANAIAYDVRDYVMNMGAYGLRRYGIVCDGGGTPAADKNCDLASWNPLSVPAPTLATVSSISPQMVELQAQYGIAPAGSEIVNEWIDATGNWGKPFLEDPRRIKAVRISLVARGNREGNELPPTSVLLWQDDPADPTTARALALTATEQRFRYQALTVVVPLINAIWAGS